jgi:hypothetical protein
MKGITAETLLFSSEEQECSRNVAPPRNTEHYIMFKNRLCLDYIRRLVRAPWEHN